MATLSVVFWGGTRPAGPWGHLIERVVERELRARLPPDAAPVCVAAVPHPGLLLHRMLDRDTAPARVRELGHEPGAYVVAASAELADAVPGAVPVPDDLSVEDVLAVLAASRAVVATDEHLAAVAAGLGVPWVLLDPRGEHRAAALEFGDPGQIVGSAADLEPALRTAEPVPPREELIKELDAHFDQAAALVTENTTVHAAYRRLRERLVLERQRLAEPLAEAWHRRDVAVDEAARLRARNEALTARLADLEREWQAWQNTRLVRWTRPLRTIYGRLRGRGRPS